MKIIYAKDLTAAEHKAMEARYDGYHHCAEFWVGFVDYQHGRYNCPHGWTNSVAGQAWDRGAEAAMRLHWERYRCEYARDDLDGRKQISGIDAAIEELKKTRS
jgi:hypothetical protein